MNNCDSLGLLWGGGEGLGATWRSIHKAGLPILKSVGEIFEKKLIILWGLVSYSFILFLISYFFFILPFLATLTKNFHISIDLLQNFVRCINMIFYQIVEIYTTFVDLPYLYFLVFTIFVLVVTGLVPTFWNLGIGINQCYGFGSKLDSYSAALLIRFLNTDLDPHN